MDHSATLSAPARRARRIVGAGLATLAVAVVAITPFRILVRMLSLPLQHPSRQVWLTTLNGIMLVMVVLLPVAAVTAGALAGWRRSTGRPAAWRSSLAEVAMVYGTLPWVWYILLPGLEPGKIGQVSLVPLRDLQAQVADGAVGQIVGNLLVFAALGFFVPLRFPALASVTRVLALAAGCSILVETLQYVLRLDRVSSIDDVLLNAAGAGLAALVSRPWWGAPVLPPGTSVPGGAGRA
ncbi:VanZ family protein [Actinoplanes sp. L3-i22]|uniref:VanZ family protein n=1 Tax=Actinoplanes sp. L3-i22 TaxID=2836373 RepID=UPI001C863AB3|nr:VanZ family protein [Actinoplanes sp. L3-i22]